MLSSSAWRPFPRYMAEPEPVEENQEVTPYEHDLIVRYAIVGMFIAAAVLTPPDVISQVGLAVPLLLLYELSIIAATWMNRPKKTPADKTKT